MGKNMLDFQALAAQINSLALRIGYTNEIIKINNEIIKLTAWSLVDQSQVLNKHLCSMYENIAHYYTLQYYIMCIYIFSTLLM